MHCVSVLTAVMVAGHGGLIITASISSKERIQHKTAPSNIERASNVRELAAPPRGHLPEFAHFRSV